MTYAMAPVAERPMMNTLTKVIGTVNVIRTGENGYSEFLFWGDDGTSPEWVLEIYLRTLTPQETRSLIASMQNQLAIAVPK